MVFIFATVDLIEDPPNVDSDSLPASRSSAVCLPCTPGCNFKKPITSCQAAAGALLRQTIQSSESGFFMLTRQTALEWPIKRIAKQFQFEMREFHIEVKLGNMPLHRNLVPIISFCLPLKLKEDMLMYSFVLNGSFSSLLRRQPSVKLPLDWPTRKKIAVGALRGISHLHDHGVIHRCIKPQIILLGENFEVCIVDSGWPSSWTTMKRRVFPGKPVSLASAFFTAK
ncbi:hypothetical protein NL676_016995 [Syzygium grande]|nr:hypothetical protein NL676_016995 [Syzygium grande]